MLPAVPEMTEVILSHSQQPVLAAVCAWVRPHSRKCLTPSSEFSEEDLDLKTIFIFKCPDLTKI